MRTLRRSCRASRLSTHTGPKGYEIYMQSEFSRTGLLLGETNMDILNASRVLIFGVGGVGGYVAEGLARSGIGSIDIVDNDKVSLSNINRQIIALHSTLGRDKVDVVRERLLDINPSIKVTPHKCFYLPETADRFDFSEYDYVIDAIDTVTGKIQIIMQADAAGVPVISSMGCGNKLDPTKLKVTDIYSTSVCPLARVMRRELKKRGIKELKVVYSEEPAIKPIEACPDADTHPASSDADPEHARRNKAVPGSTAFVPSTAGLIIASEVVKDLISM